MPLVLVTDNLYDFSFLFSQVFRIGQNFLMGIEHECLGDRLEVSDIDNQMYLEHRWQP